MVKRILCRIVTWRRVQTRHPERESGQSLIILAFAFLGLIAMLGLALDLGLVYIERVRLKRAVDAATLAGVVELPYEDQSYQRALEYLELNGYDTANSNVYISGCVRDINGDPSVLVNATNYPYNLVADPRAATFYLDTWAYQSDHDQACSAPGEVGNANKLEITGTVSVNMNFMQFFGFKYVDVSDSAVAQNVDNLDVVVVFDRSGSMHYDPVCYGCWVRDPGLTEADIPQYYEYPSNGQIYPISNTQASEYCLIDPATGGLNPGGYPPTSFVDNDGQRYIIIEAELYSSNNTQPETELRSQGKGYWALQRDGNGSLGLDGRGGYMAHHPEQTFYPETNPYGRFYTLTDAQNGNAPTLGYQFSINRDESPDLWGSQAYVWVRARRSACPFDRCTDQYGNVNRSTFYWSLDDASTSSLDFPPRALTTDQYSDLDADPDEWRWISLDKFPISPGQSPDNLSGPYTLRLFAGSSGIRIDRIIITNNSDPSLPSAAQTHAPTPGSAYGEACDPCNPIYALTVDPSSDCLNFSPEPENPDLRMHPLWDDWEQPLRSSKEAIKRFAMRLDPKRDQVGLVTYSTSSSQDSQLECLSRWRSDCYEGTTPISYTKVLAAIESVESEGYTCTGCGMRDGLKVLGIDIDNEGSSFNKKCDGGADSHCARGGAKKVMILITDGVPNVKPKDKECDKQDYYPGAGGEYDCMIYYARQGRLKGVTIFTIGLGFGVDPKILEAVAEEGGGFYRHAASASNLDGIFEEILSNIYVRIIR
jgi:Flp pilus assembly protein TadG